MTRIAGLVLAAGLSTRFAGDKLVFPYRGKPLAAHAAETIAEMPVQFRLAVCPASNAARQAIFRAHEFEIISNDNPGAGLSSSLVLGARRAIELDADILLVSLADMPNVPRQHLLDLVAAVDHAGDIVASISAGRRSPPAAFARPALRKLLTLEGDKGARVLVETAATVEIAPGFAVDFDTPEDFERAGAD